MRRVDSSTARVMLTFSRLRRRARPRTWGIAPTIGVYRFWRDMGACNPSRVAGYVQSARLDTPARTGRRAGLPGVPAGGAADAGTLTRGAHPAGLLRDLLPGDGAVRGVAAPSHGQPGVPGARKALVEGDAGPVRGRCGD